MSGRSNIKTSSRLVSPDAFRGSTIAGMVLVNNPRSWAHLLAAGARRVQWLDTATDLIFPFILGVAIRSRLVTFILFVAVSDVATLS